MEIISTIILGIITSLIASIVFTCFFTQLKPDLKISSEIMFNNGSYKITVENKSCFAAINIKAELSYVNYFTVNGKQETNAENILLKKNELFSLDKFDKNSQFATYTFMFIANDDLIKGLTQHNRDHLRFKISATHSLSNIGKVFQQKFTKDQVIKKEFNFET